MQDSAHSSSSCAGAAHVMFLAGSCEGGCTRITAMTLAFGALARIRPVVCTILAAAAFRYPSP
jgi:hypothetical protein